MIVRRMARAAGSWIIVRAGVWMMVGAAGLAALLRLSLPEAVDVQQPRLNMVASPAEAAPLVQTFAARHNGLSAIEWLAAVPAGGSRGAALTATLLDRSGAVVAAKTFDDVAHNSRLRLEFRPQPASLGQEYTLALLSPGQSAGVWAYHRDGYRGGQLSTAGAGPLGDLHFSTYYTYQWRDMARDAWQSLARLAGALAPFGLVFFGPGLLVMQWLRIRPATAGEHGGLALALSLCAGPVLWLWTTQLHWRWTETTLAAAYALIGLLVVLGWLWDLRQTVMNRRVRLTVNPVTAALAAIVTISLVARLAAVRDLALPAWVDSPHHALVWRLIEAGGQVPLTYLPELPVDNFTYHFGIHVTALTFAWIADWTIPDTLVIVGQALNGLVPLAGYAMVAGLSGRPRAGLIAAAFIGFVSLFPAYYVSWGRYSQLAGLLILAPAIALIWRTVQARRGATAPAVIATALIAAGIFLTHYRVTAFLLVFVIATAAGWSRRHWGWALAAAALTALLTWPWMLNLYDHWIVPLRLGQVAWAGPSGNNAIPWEYFAAGTERGWLWAALLVMVIGVLAGSWQMRLAAAWVAGVFLVLNVGSGTWIVNNNSWAISWFVPGAWVLGWGADRGLRLGELGMLSRSLSIRLGGMAATGGLSAVMVIFAINGLRAQIAIVNPATILASAEDRLAIEWVQTHTEPDAGFLINSWEWQPRAWAGSDGGAWLWPLALRRTSTPPLDYLFDAALVEQIDALNRAVLSSTALDSPESRGLLRANGITHVFIGARGGHLRPEMFIDSPHYRLLYTNGAAWVFELVGD